MPPSSEITRLVGDLTAGNRAAVDSLMPLVYDELRVIARRHMKRERADHTLDTTGLVHEAYLSLLKNERLDWQGRAHLLSMAAIAMRRILVDYARRRATDKRGSGLAIITLDDSLLPHESRPEEFIQLDEALTSLNTHNPRLASVVTYKFFGGLTQGTVLDPPPHTKDAGALDWRPVTCCHAALEAYIGVKCPPPTREPSPVVRPAPSCAGEQVRR